MMRRIGALLLVILLVLVSGCSDKITLDEAIITLVMGLDLDENNNLIIYSTSPVFSKEAKVKSERYAVKTKTIRQSRNKLDAEEQGMVVRGKVQVILLGKKLLQHGDWYPLLDVFYRDAKITITEKMIAVDGKVEDVINFYPSDKPRLGLQLTKLIDTAHHRNVTVRTTLRDFNWQMMEKGVTPFISELKKEKELILTGTALLDKRAKYVSSFRLYETQLLQLMNYGKRGEISLTIPLELDKKESNASFPSKRISFYVTAFKKKVKTNWKDGRFVFDVHIKINAFIAERTMLIDFTEQKKELEKKMAAELKKGFSRIIQKCQKQKIDPFGFGLQARAYQYEQWKQVKDKWGETFGQATVKVVTDVEVKSHGVIK